jgi:2-iminobutanoate/2-iminopropanoate deaminase
MTRRATHSDDAPKPVGPYSQAIVANGMLYAAGQVPLDPDTGALVVGDITVQARRVFDNLTAVLASANSGWQHVVKVTVYLTNLTDGPALNAVYAEYVVAPTPARTTVEVSKLPLGSTIEIDLIAVVPA